MDSKHIIDIKNALINFDLPLKDVHDILRNSIDCLQKVNDYDSIRAITPALLSYIKIIQETTLPKQTTQTTYIS